MKLPGGLDMESMMRQAQQMQEQMGREMKEMTRRGGRRRRSGIGEDARRF